MHDRVLSRTFSVSSRELWPPERDVSEAYHIRHERLHALGIRNGSQARRGSRKHHGDGRGVCTRGELPQAWCPEADSHRG
jgi:hypothetical protein